MAIGLVSLVRKCPQKGDTMSESGWKRYSEQLKSRIRFYSFVIVLSYLIPSGSVPMSYSSGSVPIS